MSFNDTKIKVNKTIGKTYSYLKGNYSQEEFLNKENISEFIILNETNVITKNYNLSEKNIRELADRINGGINSKLIDSLIFGTHVNYELEDKSNLKIKNTLSGEGSTYVYNILLKENSSGDVCFKIMGNGYEFNHFYNINLGRNSKLHVTIFCNTNAIGYINFIVNCEENSEINVVLINLNENSVYTNGEIYLNGNLSKGNINVAYIGRENYKFDYNLTNSFIGKECIGNIYAKGVLLNSFNKIFKGALNFNKGCINSLGSEKEEAIILGKNVKNQSLPLLLCKEKNVSGSHGFTANSIDENKMFYLLSRGFSESQGKALILEGKFVNLLKEVNDEDIVEGFLDVLRGEL